MSQPNPVDYCFELVSVMKINWNKSCIAGINSNLEDFIDITDAMGYQVRSFPFDYL